MDNYFLGEIVSVGFNYTCEDTIYCWGQKESIAQYTAIYSLFGGTFGPTDGRTYFTLPDLRGYMPVGAGQGVGMYEIDMGPQNMQQLQGNNSQHLTYATMPMHSHEATITIPASSATADNVNSPVNNYPAASIASINRYYGTSGLMSNAMGAGTMTLQPAGTQTPASFSIMNPYLAINFCLVTDGVYPQRP